MHSIEFRTVFAENFGEFVAKQMISQFNML